MDYVLLATLAGFTLIYSALAGRIERGFLSGPIVFVAFGALIGPLGFGLMSMESDPELIRVLAELTLAIVLFTDAAGANLRVILRSRRLPIRLLAIGLPLTILLGFGIGEAMFSQTPWLEVLLLATVLAPTDAALGQTVVSNEGVPEPIREGLKVESGLNDGICVPIVLLLLTLIEGKSEASAGALALRFFLENVGIGVAVGLGVSGGAVWLLDFCHRRDWLSHQWTRITVVAVAFVCFGASQALGGSGFIACFVGGLLFDALLRPKHEPLLEASEAIGSTFALLTWVLFGAAVIDKVSDFFNWTIALYALLSLTVIRMLPVFIATTGVGLNVESRLFVGWFGPRGLASAVFAVMILEAEIPHADFIVEAVALTIVLSILAHGVSATPWAKAFGARAQGRAPKASS